MSSATWTRIASVTATTLRNAAGGGARANNLVGIKCTPPTPAGMWQRSIPNGQPLDALETLTDGDQDIVAGDALQVTAGDTLATYPIREVQEYPYRSTRYLLLILERLK